MRAAEIRYFAYGSNMSSRRLQRRVPGARALGPARLAGFRLVWHARGSDGSAKCDIVRAGAAEVVHGVLYAIEARYKPRLDRAEGLGRVYGEAYVSVSLAGGHTPICALSYYALRVDRRCIPYDWYREHVLAGAREHGLPAACICRIAMLPVRVDVNRRRARAERRVHRDT